MIKHNLCILRAFFCTSSNIEQHKPTPTQRKAQQQGIMAKKILLQKYQLLKSQPTDNIDQISNNYIQLKRLYNSRRYYIPDKKNYLIMLDQCYNDILKVHEDYNYLQLGKDTGLINKKEAITYELKAIRTAEYLALLQTYEASGLILCFMALMLIIGEESNSEKEGIKILQMFSFTTRVKKMIDDFHAKKLEQHYSRQKKQLVSNKKMKKYEQLGLQYKLKPNQMSAEELKQKAIQKVVPTNILQNK